MNKKKFFKIIENPKNLSKKDIEFIKEINNEYPFFQPSKAIYLKFLKNKKDIKFNKYLSSTAIHTKDREILFNFLHDKEENKKRKKNISVKKEKKTEYNSFVNWLELTNIKPIDGSNQKNLINKFISKKPKLNISSKDENNSNSESKEIVVTSGYITETLARLYYEQKNYEKAIESYSILILKFPEKKSYFANQIKKIKRKIK